MFFLFYQFSVITKIVDERTVLFERKINYEAALYIDYNLFLGFTNCILYLLKGISVIYIYIYIYIYKRNISLGAK